MTAASEEIFAYHIGIVVRDIDAVAKCYEAYLNVPRWHTWEVERDGLPTNPATAGNRGRVRIAYGRAAGQTIELLQPITGTSIWSIFLQEHGEGVQHLGVWTPDLAGAVERAIARGAKITHGILRADGGSVQLSATSPLSDLVGALDADQIAYADPGIGGVQIEYVGPGGPDRMRQAMGEDFENVIAMPPWQGPSRS